MSAPSHYYLNCSDDIASIIDSIEWDYESAKYDTAGNPSISKNELICKLESILEEGKCNT